MYRVSSGTLAGVAKKCPERVAAMRMCVPDPVSYKLATSVEPGASTIRMGLQVVAGDLGYCLAMASAASREETQFSSFSAAIKAESDLGDCRSNSAADRNLMQQRWLPQGERFSLPGVNSCARTLGCTATSCWCLLWGRSANPGSSIPCPVPTALLGYTCIMGTGGLCRGPIPFVLLLGHISFRFACLVPRSLGQRKWRRCLLKVFGRRRAMGSFQR